MLTWKIFDFFRGFWVRPRERTLPRHCRLRSASGWTAADGNTCDQTRNCCKNKHRTITQSIHTNYTSVFITPQAPTAGSALLRLYNFDGSICSKCSPSSRMKMSKVSESLCTFSTSQFHSSFCGSFLDLNTATAKRVLLKSLNLQATV
jgi:hypothetical protein